jgi:hypothetical protein
MWLFAFVFFVIGLLSIISPRTSWYMSNWWRFQGNIEPSDASLILQRIGGILFIIVAVIVIYKS